MQKKSKIKVIVSVLLFAFLVAIGVGYFMYNKPHTDVAKSEANIIVSAHGLINDFEIDETKANTKYLEQIVEVTGTISEISMNGEKGIIAIADGDLMGSVLCHLSASETKKMNELKLGETVSVKGICTGYLMDVILVKAIIKK